MDGRQQAEEAYPESIDLLSHYVDILASRGIDWGIIGPREADRLWERHVLNSLALVDLIPKGIEVADVGSGGGLPGVPLAITRPDLRVTLIEPLLRRSEFLQGVVDELGLEDRVEVHRTRAEDARQKFDAVTCRAVASLDKLLKWCSPLFLPDGTLYALKGVSAAEEVAAAGSLLKSKGLVAEVIKARAHPDADVTNVVLVKVG